ncbi:hypothetical protein ACH4ZX_40030 [Streptomyces sp. NPDC020490]
MEITPVSRVEEDVDVFESHDDAYDRPDAGLSTNHCETVLY